MLSILYPCFICVSSVACMISSFFVSRFLSVADFGDPMTRAQFALMAVVALPVTADAAEPVAPRPASFRTDVIAALSPPGAIPATVTVRRRERTAFVFRFAASIRTSITTYWCKESGGRRINRQTPDDSLFLLKASGRVSHGGGAVIGRSDPAYRVLGTLGAEGCSMTSRLRCVRLEVLPDQKRLLLRHARRTAQRPGALQGRHGPRRHRPHGLHVQRLQRRDGHLDRPRDLRQGG